MFIMVFVDFLHQLKVDKNHKKIQNAILLAKFLLAVFGGIFGFEQGLIYPSTAAK
jgi:hypothetical protein